jgi:hypothetical protein
VESDTFIGLMFLTKLKEMEEKKERTIAHKNGTKPKRSSVNNLSRRLNRMYVDAMISKIQNNIENNKHEVEENELLEELQEIADPSSARAKDQQIQQPMPQRRHICILHQNHLKRKTC